MADVALVKIRYLHRFARALERHRIPVAKPLESAGLDPRMLDIRDGYIPMSQLHAFARVAVQESGIRHLGLEAGLSPREEHSDFSRGLALAPSLRETLQTLITQSRTEDTTAVFRVIKGSDNAWLCCSRVRAHVEAARQIELFRYGALVEVIRYAAGPDWLPEALELQSPDDGCLDDLSPIRDVDVCFGARRLAIAMPLELLGKSLNPDDPLLDRSGRSSAPTGPESFDQAIKEVIRTHVKTRQYSLGCVARALDMSTRSLQRRLSDHGTTFSKLLEESRIEIASHQLGDQSRSLSDIASGLGYRHNTHFSRAFKRVRGVTPREYRNAASRG